MVGNVYKDHNARIKVLKKEGKLFICSRWLNGNKVEVKHTKQELEAKKEDLICTEL